MKAGRSLNDLAAELERQSKSKRDYVADTRKIRMEAGGNGVILKGVNGGMHLRKVAHQQMASQLSIPKPYYDRMLQEAPDLLARNVNTWLDHNPEQRLVRTLDGEVRAILSDRYRPLDNLDLAEAVLPSLLALDAEVMSGEVTENRFYLKAVTHRIQGAVALNDHVQAGLVISNSEVGQGSLRVEALDFRLVCLNGMIREQAIRKAHLGRGSRGQDAIEDSHEYFRSATKVQDDKAFFMKVTDTVGAMFNQDRFNLRIKQYQEAGTHHIKSDPIEVVEVTAKRFGLSEGEGNSVLKHLLSGGSLTQWGLANAITRASQDVESYDRATDLEAMGGQVVELSPGEWKILAN